MTQKRKTVVVTGAEGFIGTHLCKRLLREGHVVVGIDNKNPDGCSVYSHTDGHVGSIYFHSDIRDQAEMKLVADEIKGGELPIVNAVFHLAAVAAPNVARDDPDKAWSTNVMGTHNVLQLALQLGQQRVLPRVIFFSSAHVYGISPKYIPTDEFHPLALYDTYTTTKILGEQLCQLFYRNHGLPYTTLRLFNAYGPGQSDVYFVGKKIAQARTGSMTIWNGDVTKDWVYVEDVVDACLLAMETGYVGALNVGTGVETSLRRMIAILAGHYQIPSERIQQEDSPPPGGPTRMLADWRLIRRILGWTPKTAVEVGLAKIADTTKEETPQE